MMTHHAPIRLPGWWYPTTNRSELIIYYLNPSPLFKFIYELALGNFHSWHCHIREHISNRLPFYSLLHRVTSLSLTLPRSKPLQIWDKQVRNGHIKRITDQDIQSSVLEIMGTNVSTSFITCPAEKKSTLGIKLPFLVMIIKNVSSGYFS